MTLTMTPVRSAYDAVFAPMHTAAAVGLTKRVHICKAARVLGANDDADIHDVTTSFTTIINDIITTMNHRTVGKFVDMVNLLKTTLEGIVDDNQHHPRRCILSIAHAGVHVLYHVFVSALIALHRLPNRYVVDIDLVDGTYTPVANLAKSLPIRSWNTTCKGCVTAASAAGSVRPRRGRAGRTLAVGFDLLIRAGGTAGKLTALPP